MRGERVKVGEREEDQSESMERKEWTPRWRRADSIEEREGKQEEPP